jgi:hypothetical protein
MNPTSFIGVWGTLQSYAFSEAPVNLHPNSIRIFLSDFSSAHAPPFPEA